MVAAAAALAGAQAPEAQAAQKVLTVTGPTGTRSYTLRQLKTGFIAYKGYAGYVKTGFVGMEKPHPVKGVRLLDLLRKVGYRSGSVTLGARDGYRFSYSSSQVRGKKVTMYKAKAPKYPRVTVPGTNPLTAIIAYQHKKVGARVADSNPWRNYAADGRDGIGPLRFWWAYKKWVTPGYVQIGWSSMRTVRTVKVD
jgi:hypothetical protein